MRVNNLMQRDLFFQWDVEDIEDTETVKIFEVESDTQTHTTHQVITSNDPVVFMCTSPRSPSQNGTSQKEEIKN